MNVFIYFVIMFNQNFFYFKFSLWVFCDVKHLPLYRQISWSETKHCVVCKRGATRRTERPRKESPETKLQKSVIS